jgi:peptidoglycan L-alanyl-D-glutamate endopeptidase CwlK
MDAVSKGRLAGVHPDLVRVVERADADGGGFKVIEGMRTLARQKMLKAKGSSTTLNSRHLTGHAVDVVPIVDGQISWAWPDYYLLAKRIKAAAKAEGVPLEWGGDWSKFKDGPHWQLPWKHYPVTRTIDDEPATASTDAQASMKRASLVSGTGTAGAALSEYAGQLAPLAEFSQVIKWVFVGLLLAGVAYGLWGWWRGSRGGDRG